MANLTLTPLIEPGQASVNLHSSKLSFAATSILFSLFVSTITSSFTSSYSSLFASTNTPSYTSYLFLFICSHIYLLTVLTTSMKVSTVCNSWRERDTRNLGTTTNISQVILFSLLYSYEFFIKMFENVPK